MTIKTKIGESGHKFFAQISQEFPKLMRKELMRAAEEGAGIIRETIFTDWLSRSNTGLSTGKLARSFKPTLLTTLEGGLFEGDVYGAGIFSDVVYAAIHDEGGYIWPSKAKNLAVPLNKTARRSKPTAYSPKLRFAITPAGHKVLAKQLKTKIKPQYVLLDKVYIKPQHYLQKSVPKIGTMLRHKYKHTLGTLIKVKAAKFQKGI